MSFRPHRRGLQGVCQTGLRRAFASKSKILSWACALLQSPPNSEPPFASTMPAKASLARAAPPVRSLPLQRIPVLGSSITTRFTSPRHLRPQVFSTSRRLHPPSTWQPCFMLHPLLGSYPSELCSSRVAVRRLRRHLPSCRCLLRVPRSLVRLQTGPKLGLLTRRRICFNRSARKPHHQIKRYERLQRIAPLSPPTRLVDFRRPKPPSLYGRIASCWLHRSGSNCRQPA